MWKFLKRGERGRLERRDWLLGVSLGLGLAVALSWPLLGSACLAVVAMIALACLGTGLLARRKIGGQTGDVLGACQQLCEVAGLLSLAAILSQSA